MPEEYRDVAGTNGNGPGTIVINPSDIESAAPEPERAGGRKPRSDRGKPRGSRGTATKKADRVALDLSSLTGMFVGLHVAAAKILGENDLIITDDEGKQFMTAAQNVMRHYSVETTQKTLDWIAFAGTCGQIYGTRIIAISMKSDSPKQSPRPQAVKQAQPQPTGDVVFLNPDHPGPFPNGA